MKRLITLLFVLLTLLWVLPAYSQANRQVFCRIRDNNTPGSMADVLQLQLTMPATTWGLVTRSGRYLDTGAACRAITGGQLNADGLAATNWGIDSRSFLLGYDTVADNWNRVTIHAYGDGLSATQDGTDSLSYTLFFDTGNTVSRRWLGDELSSDAVVTTTIAPYVGSMGHIHLTDGDVWARDKGETADGGVIAATVGAAYRFGLDYGYDSTAGAWRYVNTLDAVADDLALSLNWKTVAAVQLYYDGSTLDMGRVGATGGVQQEVVNWPNSYDPGNAQQNFNKKNTQPVTPVKETTATIGTAVVTCFASRSILSDPNWCLYIKNTDGVDPMVDVDIEISPDNATWIDLGWNTCDGMIAGAACSYCVSGNAYRYVRMRCQAADANPTSSDVWYTANKD